MNNALKPAVCTLLTGLLVTPLCSAQQQRGTVCIAPNCAERPSRISPGGDYNPATLSVRIDKGQWVLWPHKESVKISDLALGERHLVAVVSDGKRIQSFWFRFSSYKSGELCVSFDGYQGVQLQETRYSPWCKCK